MQTVNFRELRAHLAEFLRQTQAGETFVVTSRGREVARLLPPGPAIGGERKPGGLAGQIWMAPDFDETPEDIIAAMEGDGV